MVTIRFKKVKSGKFSTYLDYIIKDNNGTPERKYEFLRIYVSKDYSKVKRIVSCDKEAMGLANQIRSKRELEIYSTNGGSMPDGRFNNHSLFGYIRHQVEFQGKRAYSAPLSKLETYSKRKDLPFSAVSPAFIESFFQYLKKSIAHNTAIGHLKLLKAIFNKAYKEGVIQENPFKRYIIPRTVEPQRSYLELHELKMLANTPFSFEPQVKQLFLFACFTGLRLADLLSLDYSMFQSNSKTGENGLKLVFRPQKTESTSGTLLELPLSEQAIKIFKETGPVKRNGIVFSRLPHETTIGDQIKKWAKLAGITKKVHMHMARHTFATLCLSSGIGIYTVSKLLGHSSLRNTEIYSRLLSERKLLEINKFPDFMKGAKE
jgi:site-specific recombinase XerD